jgi:hypothetical protein
MFDVTRTSRAHGVGPVPQRRFQVGRNWFVTFWPLAARYERMKMHLLIRRFAGIFILVSLLLAHYHSPYWLWLTAFVGFNLLQSSFTNFCPLEIVLKKIGVGKSCCENGKSEDSCCTK